ncbi:MAG: DNA polymerase I [Actinomycetota bacterium]|nr:DNA polymerase I [Actinomycetota bacterium]
MASIFALDGNSLAHRAFHALPEDMMTSSGQMTNAVHGFTAMLANIVAKQHPDGLVVAFDRRGPTFRDEIIDTYKAGRKKAPQVFYDQLDLIHRVVETLSIPLLDAERYEADDVLATVATWLRDHGHDVVVVTGDRDAFQLVEDPHVRVMYNLRGVSDYALYDEAGVTGRTGVKPAQYPVLAALRGDPSDNLPGVPGVGDKTAARLINTYGSLDEIYANLEDLSPKLKASLATHEAQARSNARLIPLVRDVPLDLDIERMKLGNWDEEEVQRFFSFLEMPSVLRRIREAWPTQIPPGSNVTTVRASVVEDTNAAIDLHPGEARTQSVEEDQVRPTSPTKLSSPEPTRPSCAGELRDLIAAIIDSETIYVDFVWASKPARSAAIGMTIASTAVADSPAPRNNPIWINGDLLREAEVAEILRLVFRPGGPGVTAHRCKEIMRSLDELGIEIHRLDIDTAVGAYLLDASGDQPTLADLALRYCQIEMSENSIPSGQLALDVTSDDPAVSSARRAIVLSSVAEQIKKRLEAEGLWLLYENVERPLVKILAQMELAGIRVDVQGLRELLDKLATEGHYLEDEIHRLAGSDFKINSPQQLQVILYQDLGLAPQKKTKTGYSTDAASLERLRGQHPIVEALLRYREVEKLRSTYAEGLLNEIGPDGRIHATFNQTVTRTGRLSSDQPNLHNIPIRTESGAQFRKVFVPSEGADFLVADYDQIELRIIAHLSRDPGLVEAFSKGTDVHRMVASRVFGVPAEEVTHAMRSKAKMVSYGLAYGMEAYGLARRLGIEHHDAEKILDAYFASFPGVLEYMERSVKEARERGYTITLFGRRRPVPELRSAHRADRLAAERQAMNAGIQGLAADIFKVALVKLHAQLEQERLRSQIVLQVHDEILVEVPQNERLEAEQITSTAMTTACELEVPLEINIAWGSTWAEAKP